MLIMNELLIEKRTILIGAILNHPRYICTHVNSVYSNHQATVFQMGIALQACPQYPMYETRCGYCMGIVMSRTVKFYERVL